MESWNKLLKRQIWKHMGDKPIPEEMQTFLQTISNSYDHYDRENAHLSRIMDLSSEELFSANFELRKRNEELDRFIYSASHDLRAPLTSILGLLDLIEQLDRNEDIDEYLSHIKTSATKLDNFIGDIVMYTRNKKTDVVLELIDFENLIFSCIEKLDFMPNAQSIKKTVSVKSNHNFYSDTQRLDNILSNLISNSIKYFNSDQSNSFCEISVVTDKKQVEILIKDNGIGIAQEHVEKIFNMFYRASYQSKGSGIGLYIVKEMVQKLGGSITVSSELNVGSTFQIILPIQGS